MNRSPLSDLPVQLPPVAMRMRERMLARRPFSKEEDEFILQPPPEFLREVGRQRAGQPDIRKMATHLERSSGSVRDRRNALRRSQRGT